MLSRVRVSVRPSNFFIREKHPKSRGNRFTSACVYLNDPAEQAKRCVNSVTLGRHRPIEPERRRWCVCVRVRLCVRDCVRECACVHARACVSACFRDVFATYDNNISPRLIMIIIKIIIPYLIQIRHTDDFPSTGTRLVLIKQVYTRIAYILYILNTLQFSALGLTCIHTN